MSKKGYANLGMLKSLGFHSEGLSPVTCSAIWKMMLIPSMLYGCEVWGSLPKKELNVFEVVQKRIGKHIQGLHRRTHDEIVRGLLGWTTIESVIDKCKMNFVYKLMDLPYNNIVKHIFLCQIYSILFVPMAINCNSFTYDLWLTLLKYDNIDLVLSYLTGDKIENKKTWKRIVDYVIHSREEHIWKQGLRMKGANRFLRIHNELAVHPIYTIIKERMPLRAELLNTIKLLAYPEISETEQCELCQCDYVDTVEHFLLRCQGRIQDRTAAWDKILDCLDCEAEALLLNQSEEMILDTLLSKHWDLLKNSNDYAIFSCTAAIELMNIMRVY